MKKICIVSATLISFIIFAFAYQQRTLVGKWEAKTSDGTIFGVVFKADHTYVGYANKKVFVSGNYNFKDNLLTIDDQLCTGKGAYQITFFADSIRFSVVTDSCGGRRQGTNKMVLGLVKSK